MKQHPFTEPLEFGNEKQIYTYRRMEAIKTARQTLDAIDDDVMRGALRQAGRIEERDVFVD